MSNGVLLTKKSVRKIKTGLDWINNQPKNHDIAGYNQQYGRNGFWAVIEGRTTDSPVGSSNKNKCFYSWNRLVNSGTMTELTIFGTNYDGNINTTQRAVSSLNTLEGDYKTDEQDNYAVEFPNASPYVLAGDVVWMFPTQKFRYYNFIYNPGIRMALTTESISPATLGNSGNLTLGSGKVNPIKFNLNQSVVGDALYKYSASDTDEWQLKVFNTFRSEIEYTEDKPTVIQMQYGYPGYWFITAAECGDVIE